MSQFTQPLQDVTVIGAGPAGTTAAMYAARKGWTVTLVADRVGGQSKDAAYLDNLVGAPKVLGVQFANDLLARIAEHKITLKQYIQVQKVEPGEVSTLHLSTGETFQSKSVIMATGAQWRKLGVPGEIENIGNGISYCVHCHGPNFNSKEIAVIGAGSQALQAALDLSNTARTVWLVAKNVRLDSDQLLIEQIQNRDNIKTLLRSKVVEVMANNGKVVAIRTENQESGVVEALPVQGVFVQVGSTPNSQLMREILKLNALGEVVIDHKCQTSERGIYACGDVSTVPYKQVVVAMGEGVKAALAASEYLLSKR